MVRTRHRVRIEDASDDLLEALSVRGLAAERVNGAIEVAAAGEEGLWNLELVAALEAWLEDRHRDEVKARVDDVEYTVRAPEARRSDETGELPVPAERARSRVDPVAVAAIAGTVLLLAAGIWFLLAVIFQLV